MAAMPVRDLGPSKPNLKALFSTFLGDWMAIMSGVLSVPFGLIALFWGYARWIFGALSIIGAYCTTYRVWSIERLRVIDLSKKVEDLISVAPQIEVTILNS
jgi:hypothetical protein